jgi:hypothetical protein
MLETRKELPGDVIASLRKTKGHHRSATSFANLSALSYDTLHRLEMVRWDTVQEEWVRPVDIADLDGLLRAGFLVPGDEFWMRFEAAFAWQQMVIDYGRKAYDETFRVGYVTPVPEEQVIALVRSVVTQEVRGLLEKGISVADAAKERIYQRALSDVTFRLTSVGLLHSGELGGPFRVEIEQTRDPYSAIAGAVGELTPYLSTLRLVYVWARQATARATKTESQG